LEIGTPFLNQNIEPEIKLEWEVNVIIFLLMDWFMKMNFKLKIKPEKLGILS